MSQNFRKLITLLKELFQLDQPDLDFGLYRIMHAKSDEVSQFLEKDLLPQVQAAFKQHQSTDKAALEVELGSMIKSLKKAGVNPEQASGVKDLRAKIGYNSGKLENLEGEVYDHLYSFFRRYYHEGDFLSKRVYKQGVYAIPYEGEEVKLHWANKDQYYIKTDEYLKDYAFRLRAEDEDKPMRVHFKLVDASEGEHGNVKATEGNDRCFILAPAGESGHDFLSVENDELSIAFEYRPATMVDWVKEHKENATEAAKKKPPVKKVLLEQAIEAILKVNDPSFTEWIHSLSKKHLKSDGSNADYSRLEAHLKRYSARNSFDYFIHKDLGGFLSRELDFYIKNEVMHLDDIENETVARAEHYLSKIKVIRKIAGKIITFLAQLEDFQKKLWLKKKFVVETNYCITLDRIPEEFYPEIAPNEAQREEWVKLFAIDEIGASTVSPAYSEPLTVEFLKANRNLILDTQYYPETFKNTVLNNIEEFDSKVDGLCLHSENNQALQFLSIKYRGNVDCIHVDPPYNTATSGFLYKNNYEHSSWLTMMDERLTNSVPLLTEEGHFLCHIDENEYENLALLFDQQPLFNSGTLIWDKKNPMLGRKGIATQHEYVIWRSKSNVSVFGRSENIVKMKNAAKGFIEEAGGVNDLSRANYANWLNEQDDLSGGEKMYKLLNDEGDIYRLVAMGAPEPRADPKYHIPLLHPNTGKECPVPPNGWSRAPETLQSLIAEGMVVFGQDESTQPQKIVYLREDAQKQITSVSNDGKSGKSYLDPMGLNFPYCHPVSLYEHLLSFAKSSSTFIDFFAGSGTNGHAVINLRRVTNLDHKSILVEVGEHFDNVLMPRLMKVIYAPNWKHGKPQDRDNSISHCLKYIRLESYEDALNNLEPRRDNTQQDLLSSAASQGEDGLKEQYMLRYMLDVETRESPSLLNIRAFKDPTAYKLKVKRAGSDESKEVTVDLLETFNYLIGMTVDHIAAPQIFSPAFKNDKEKRLQLRGPLKAKPKGPYWFRAVRGTKPDGQRTLVIWRKLTECPEKDNLVLNEWFKQSSNLEAGNAFDCIYVNGDCNLENLKGMSDTWTVHLLEAHFHRLMFEMEDV